MNGQMQQTTDLSQAISFLSQILTQYKGTYQEHQAIQKAFMLLVDKANEAKVEIKADSIEEVSNS